MAEYLCDLTPENQVKSGNYDLDSTKLDLLVFNQYFCVVNFSLAKNVKRKTY